MEEQRKAARMRTFKGGSIIFGIAAGIDCIIRNLSDTGAAIDVKSPIGIPDDCTLLIRPEILKRNCHAEWRSANRIGVRFI